MLPGLNDAHEAVHEAITHLKEVASKYDAKMVTPELEVRFGTVTSSSFVPGMTRTALSKLEQYLDTNRDWYEVGEWTLTHAFTHASGIHNDHRVLRSEVTFISDAQRDVKTIEKKPISTSTFKLDGETRPISFRIAVAMEVHVPTKDIPLHIAPTHCVIKRRKVYTYTPTRYDHPTWAYCLTQRWHGSDLVNALVAVNTTEPVCDLELELMDMDYVMQTDTSELTMKLLWKTSDLLVAIAECYHTRPVECTSLERV